jgi:hypothetical protein
VIDTIKHLIENLQGTDIALVQVLGLLSKEIERVDSEVGRLRDGDKLEPGFVNKSISASTTIGIRSGIQDIRKYRSVTQPESLRDVSIIDLLIRMCDVADQLDSRITALREGAVISKRPAVFGGTVEIIKNSYRSEDLSKLFKHVDQFIDVRECECKGGLRCWRCIFKEDMERFRARQQDCSNEPSPTPLGLSKA